MSQTAGAAQAESRPYRSVTDTYKATAVVRHLAHELRQPLSTIESIVYYLEMVLRREDKTVRQQLEKMQEIIQQANWILSDAEHFLQATPPYLQLVQLDEIVLDCIRGFNKGEGIGINTELAADQALVYLDVEQGRHMLRNVLFFFHQLSKPVPKLWVHTYLAPGEACLEVCCEGVDCTVSELQAVFEPFSAHIPAGSGLALASVRSIAEAHGGRLGFHLSPNQKLSLRVVFPVAG